MTIRANRMAADGTLMEQRIKDLLGIQVGDNCLGVSAEDGLDFDFGINGEAIVHVQLIFKTDRKTISQIIYDPDDEVPEDEVNA